MSNLAVVAVVLTALIKIEHNGVQYGPGCPAGTEFEISEAGAKPLIEVGAAEVYQVKSDSATSTSDAALVVSLEEERAFLATWHAKLQADAADQDAQRAKLEADKAALADARTQLDTDTATLADARTKLEADQAAFDAAQAAATKKK